MKLEGAVVAVTGATAGIGRATAVAFAAAGARLSLAARRGDLLEDLASTLRQAGSEVWTLPTDVAVPAQVQAFVAGAHARFGALDVLVNNAGYGANGRVEELPAETYEQLMRVNYLGTVYGCQFAVPIMRAQRRGVIINVSSIVGHRAVPCGGAYAATKAAQISLTEALRVELAGSGVSACSVHPIGTDTEFAEVAGRASPGGPSGPLGPRQSAAVVAAAIVRCARKPRPEVYPYPASRVLVWLNALSPRVGDWLARKGAERAHRI